MMTGQNQGGSKRPPIGTILILFLLKIVSGFSRLFHIKGTYSSMNAEEQKVFSSMLDSMGRDQTKNDR